MCVTCADELPGFHASALAKLVTEGAV
jgi:hypothetical protein